MAAPAIVGLLGTAAEAYGKELATEIGGGIVETLFNQAQIAADLESIKRQLAALSDFIRNRLPALVQRATDASIAHKVEFEVVEKVRTIRGSIATLNKARQSGAAPINIQFLVSELAGHCDQVFEMGGVLISYGQPHYAAVGVAFAAGLKGYAEAAREEPARAESVLSLANTWKTRLAVWLDPAIPDSMQSKLTWLEERIRLGASCVPSFETWNTHTTREVAISWWGDPATGIGIAGAWFGYWQDKGLQGDTLAWMAPPGLTFEQAIEQRAVRPTTPTIPEWWGVKAGVPANMDDYNQCAFMLGTLITDYYACLQNEDPLKKAVALVVSTIKTCEDIVKDGGVPTVVPAVSYATALVDWELARYANVQAVLSRKVPGIGSTAVV